MAIPPDPNNPPAAPAGGSDNDLVNQFITMMSNIGAGGGGGSFGGTNPMVPIDPLGLGMGNMAGMGDPLGMAGMLNPMGGGIGLNPYQAARIRMQRNAATVALNQQMANQHRGIGRAGGRDYSRHLQNIDDEMLALQEQAVQDNIKNALSYNQQLAQYAQQNLTNNQKLFEALGGGEGRILRYGQPDQDTESPGTFSGAESGGERAG